jgi:hypothetical protein
MRTWLRIAALLILTAVSQACTGSILGPTDAGRLRPAVQPSVVQPSRPQVLNQPAVLKAQADSAWWVDRIKDVIETISRLPVITF